MIFHGCPGAVEANPLDGLRLIQDGPPAIVCEQNFKQQYENCIQGYIIIEITILENQQANVIGHICFTAWGLTRGRWMTRKRLDCVSWRRTLRSHCFFIQGRGFGGGGFLKIVVLPAHELTFGELWPSIPDPFFGRLQGRSQKRDLELGLLLDCLG